MSEQQLTRKTIASVTNFLYCGDEYLFVHRTKKGNSVDFDRLNGIGGKVEPDENFLACAVRETEEETGYVVTPQDCQLSAVINLSGGYTEDWHICCFSIRVDSKEVPKGMDNDEGRLLWLPASQVLDSGFRLVDDLNYIWPDIVGRQQLVFFSGQLDENERITQHSLFHL